ncbi:uncharacterized protein LOC119398772 [Rhipicephalus sanguineus]|uniref:uncharacterized protein LOC119398772 n=1 Tax=Rhipicephalus sanguineus TaxID=34632 RepID=UPI001892F799|nr:uncharacterized protein LOC119398772 [Rhipicephalus sanguineus]
MTSLPAQDLNGWRCNSLFSGHGCTHRDSMLQIPRFCLLQVCKPCSLYAKKSDSRCLVLLPCPEVLADITCDCFSMVFLLLLSGDIEANPGPDRRTKALLDMDSLPDDPSEKMTVIFNLIKDLHAQSTQSAKVQNTLATDVKEIRTSQKKIEAQIATIQERLDELEAKTNSIEHLEQAVDSVEASVRSFDNHLENLESRLNEQEDRSRRNNLIFRGIPDSQESWQQSESKIKSILTSTLDVLPDNAIERAHRLGSYAPTKCRPIIVKFSGFKTKEKVLSARAALKEKHISVTEDFCESTRDVRRKLFEFARNQPGVNTYQVRYKRFIMNKKQYIYDSINQCVKEVESFIEECHCSYDRITLMADGRLACLGTLQQVRDTDARGYRLEFVLKHEAHPGTTKQLDEAVQQHFVGIKLVESLQNVLTYQLPERLQRSGLFRLVALLEKDFPLEYAIVGKAMLEQVFLFLVKADKG